MEDVKVRFCKLCLTTIHGENYETENVIKHIRNLGVTLLNGVDDNSEHVTCNACSEKLLAALTFKSTCSYVDITINSYSQNTTEFPIDLKEIYMKDRGSDQMLDDMEICLLCMQTIKEIECNPVNDGLVDMLHRFVPEMNVFTIKEPVMCKLCLDSLVVHCNFLRNVEQNIGNISDNEQLSNATSATPSLDIPIKIEEVEFEEDMPQLIKTECLDINCEEIKTESEIHEQETSSEATVKYSHKSDYKTASKYGIIHENTTTEQEYKCAMRDFETKNEVHFESHTMKRKDPSEVKTYKCEICDYETKHKYAVKRHMLIHKDPSEVQMYKCDNCDFQTKRKQNLKAHMIKHKDTSEVQMYRCEYCNFETKHKGYLKSHMLNHRASSELRMYKCGNCNFETKRKGNFRLHILIHKDSSEVQMYKCDYCNYETKRKENLKPHMLKHKDPSEVQMYKCKNCCFETRYKRILKRHVLRRHATTQKL